MLQTMRVTEMSEAAEKVKRLYLRAFPENERRPFDELLYDKRGATQIIAYYEQENFIGFVILMEGCTDISYITYFAVEEEFRSMGYGASMLALLHEEKTGRRVIVDIELPMPWAKNREQRRKRKAFYLRNAYKPTGVFYRTRKENFQFLVYGGKFNKKDLDRFWKTVNE